MKVHSEKRDQWFGQKLFGECEPRLLEDSRQSPPYAPIGELVLSAWSQNYSKHNSDVQLAQTMPKSFPYVQAEAHLRKLTSVE